MPFSMAEHSPEGHPRRIYPRNRPRHRACGTPSKLVPRLAFLGQERRTSRKNSGGLLLAADIMSRMLALEDYANAVTSRDRFVICLKSVLPLPTGGHQILTEQVGTGQEGACPPRPSGQRACKHRGTRHGSRWLRPRFAAKGAFAFFPENPVCQFEVHDLQFQPVRAASSRDNQRRGGGAILGFGQGRHGA